MRFLILFLPTALWAQSTTTTYQTGVNGERVALATQEKSADGTQSQRIQSINGRPMPTEKTNEKVLRDDAGGKTVERTIQRFDANGRPSGTERILIEETKLPGGGSIAKETRSASDLNGRFAPVERRTTETRVNGQTVTSNVTVDRPTPNNGFQTTERHNIVTVGPVGKQQSTESVERADVSGRFNTVGRTESSTQIAGDKSTQNTAVYELDGQGKMKLAKQTVATTVKSPGGEVTETAVYAPASLGQASTPSDKLRLQQQQVTERRIGADGSVSEVVKVRSLSATDPTKLGDARTLSETVCTGKCLPPAAAPAQVAAPAPAATPAKPATDAKGATAAKP